MVPEGRAHVLTTKEFRDFSVIESQEEVSDLAARAEAAGLIVVWGTAVEFGDGVTLLTQVSVPPLDNEINRRLRAWSAEFDVGGTPRIIEVPFPSQVLSIGPATLSKEFLDALSPDRKFPVYESQTSEKVIDFLRLTEKFTTNPVRPTENWKASERRLQIRHLEKGLQGWIQLPELFEDANEISALVNGVLELHRGAFPAAERFFKEVLANEFTPHETQLAVHLMSAFADESWGIVARDKIENAIELDPYSRTASMYLVMSHIAELSRMVRKPETDAKEISAKIEAIENSIDTYRGNFSKDDPWLRNTRDVIEALNRT